MAEQPIDLPEYWDNPFINRLPPLRDHDSALDSLTDLPTYDPAERLYPAHIRLHCLQRLMRYFDPNERHLDLDQRIELMIRQGYVGRNPLTTDYTNHMINGHARVVARNLAVKCRPAESTATGMALIGVSGMGKTRSVQRILRRYTPQVIVHEHPFVLHQLVWLRLDCPSKGSEKQLCINFFKEVDRLLGTNFEAMHGSSRISVEKMVPQVADIAIRRAIGLLVIDEIQHVLEAKYTVRRSLMNFLVSLVNMVGVPVLLIGTPRALRLLEADFASARRVSGIGNLIWERLSFDDTWKDFVKRMWEFQWTREPSELTPEIQEVLYDESQGVIDIVIKLYLLAQLKAIQLGALDKGFKETIDAPLLRHVAEESLALVRPMLNALRSNDRRALEAYEDLVGFGAYVLQVLTDATTLMTRRPSAPPAASLSPRPAPFPTDGDAAAARIVDILGQLGVAADIAPILIAQIQAERPGLGPLELVQAVADRLRDRSPAAPTRNKKVKRATPDAGLHADPFDLCVAVPGAENSAHAQLIAKRVLRYPAEEVGLRRAATAVD